MQKEIISNERVAISLKALLNLASAATTLDLKHLSAHTTQSGGYKTAVKGRGMEFAEVRIYQAGDDVRTIDWHVTARTGKVHTKLFREERERPVFISVDNRHAMQFATRGVFKSVLAAKLAGLLAWAAQHQGDKIGGQLFSDYDCQELKPQNGKHAVLRFFNLLVSGNYNKQTEQLSLESVLARLTQHAHPGSLLYIISDFRGMNATAELHLAKLARHCDVVLLFVYDALERELPDKGQYRFTNGTEDIEIDTNNVERVQQYQQQFQQRLELLQTLAKRMRLTFIQCSTEHEPIQCLR